MLMRQSQFLQQNSEIPSLESFLSVGDYVYVLLTLIFTQICLYNKEDFRLTYLAHTCLTVEGCI